VKKERTEAEKQVADLLRTAKESLGLSLTFLSRLDGETQHLEVVESSFPMVFKDGATQPQATSLCQAILDRKLPPVIPEIAKLSEAMKLPAARFPRIRSYVSVPVVLSDGSLYGTFCAAGFTADKGLTKRDKSLMDVLARAAAVIIEPGVRQNQREAEIRDRFAQVFDRGGPLVVLQPIVSLQTGLRVGAEALSRFPNHWGKPPDVCFEEAHSIGEGILLELLALQQAAAHLDRVEGYLAMNVSPSTLLDPRCAELFGDLPADRILLELSEHDPVADYPELAATLEPLRAAGMRLAIDDVGAGFSSLRHIVLTAPDVIKLDRSIVAGVTDDPVLNTLVRSLVEFGHGCRAGVVAEGIETEQDAATLADLGVDYGQGWYFGRPGAPEDLDPPVAAEQPDRPELRRPLDRPGVSTSTVAVPAPRDPGTGVGPTVARAPSA
jgi:EAL domain-containing protein (putative c-di-GMP-specific phosphodiesterase class I)